MAFVLSAENKQPKSTKRRATARKVLVYTLKKNERTASGPNVHARALLAIGMRLAAKGHGGMVTLLRPETKKQAERLLKDLQTFDPVLVKRRTPIRLAAPREQLLSAEFLLNLVMICPATEKWKRLDFAKWLHAELLTP
jgi:citrate synthase